MMNIRAFIAMNLPVSVIEKVREVQTKLRARAQEKGAKIAWVPPANIHLTLKFLGDIPEETAIAIRGYLQPRLNDRSIFSVKVQDVGAFPNRKRPRVLWIGLKEETGQLVQLAQDIDTWLDELGFDKEKRPFHPHLTLGRVKSGATDFFEGFEEVDLGTGKVSSVVLYKSVLQRSGAEYTPLARFQLIDQSQLNTPAEVDETEKSNESKIPETIDNPSR